MTAPNPQDQQIAEAAYYLWLAEGQPEGRAEDHWQRARSTLETPAAQSRKPRAKAAPRKTMAASDVTTAKPARAGRKTKTKAKA